MQKTLITHEISLPEAIDLTTRYRKNMPPNMPICETFEKDSILKMLQTEGADKMRIYYGEKANNEICTVLVAADAQGYDILPEANAARRFDNNEKEEYILENSYRCPNVCPPESPLNPG